VPTVPARKPIEALRLAGTYREDRHGARAAVPSLPGVPVKPVDLDGEAGELWDQIVPILAENGYCSAVDTAALASACQAWAASQAAYRHFLANPTDKNARIAWAATRRLWDQAASKVGLLPADRLRMAPPADRPVSTDLADFMSQRTWGRREGRGET
jgi:phage terminase small subunit